MGVSLVAVRSAPNLSSTPFTAPSSLGLQLYELLTDVASHISTARIFGPGTKENRMSADKLYR